MKPRLCSAVGITSFLALVAGEGCTAASRRPADREVQAAVEREADAFRVSHHIPGLSVAVLEGGRVALVRGFGRADLDRQTPVTPRTMFPIGSVEKQFTAAATMRLVEQGKLSLDISGLAVISEDGAAAAARPNVAQWGPIPDEAVGEGFSSAEDSGGLYGRALYFPPGERFSYSQPNYDLLCYVLASLTGKTYYEAIGDVAKSAGLERFHAAWTPRPPADDPDVAGGYRLAGDGPEVAWEPNLGSAWTTALDLARWSEALAAGKVVSKASYERMITPARLNAGRFDVVPDGPRVDLIMRFAGGADSAEVFDRRPLSFQGGGEFVAEGAPEWREVSFTPATGRALEVALGDFAQGVRRIER